MATIEEERKAFEEKAYPHEGIEKCLTFAKGKYSVRPEWQRAWSQQLCDHVNRLFPIWLAAKAHAVEMAKPVASVRKRKDHHQWAVYFPTSLTAAAYDFPHMDDAVQWAKDNGYRVIE